MIKDAEWEEFCAWCKEQWCQYVPHKTDVELYLGWKQAKIKERGLGWEKADEDATKKTS